MYILLDCRTGGVYAVQDETREEKVVQIFVDRDDAVRYHMMLEESDKFSRKLEIAEVEEDLVKENCVNHGYAYSVISPNDFVIPPL
jgi:glutamate mutase epsilon subunit|tara:strand:+ start:5587 stop:5844 length:258 start_codon:yes stop_codon:yes gene_type:complete